MFGGVLWGGGSGSETTAGTPAKDLIYHALRLAGVTQVPDRTPSSPQLNDGLRGFQRMLQSWNRRTRDQIASVRSDLYPLSSQVESYSYGPGGDWDAVRPQKISFANFLLPTQPTITRKLQIWDPAQWSAIRMRAIYTYPTGLYYDKEDSDDPSLGRVYFHPIPDANYQVEIYTPQSLANAFDVETLLVYDEGVEQAVVYNLAVIYMGLFRDRVRDPDADRLVIEEARVSLSRIKQPYSNSPRIGTDPIKQWPRTRGFDWMSGIK